MPRVGRGAPDPRGLVVGMSCPRCPWSAHTPCGRAANTLPMLRFAAALAPVTPWLWRHFHSFGTSSAQICAVRLFQEGYRRTLWLEATFLFLYHSIFPIFVYTEHAVSSRCCILHSTLSLLCTCAEPDAASNAADVSVHDSLQCPNRKCLPVCSMMFTFGAFTPFGAKSDKLAVAHFV
ncbi:hypothetical protein Anapl_01533 [Anas platyrhynchos]|uniref:Uncharacterized protein n=1 Tax=Anas platyrhynchos TaxID=8839 RepID=R0LN36_ANAPL|nr:hypothetical protein Anapl_01533 [Anas platyrhynchos]